jgi:hypothetical protein
MQILGDESTGLFTIFCYNILIENNIAGGKNG